MNLPRFFLGLNVGRNTSEDGREGESVTSPLVCFIRVWVARLQAKREIDLNALQWTGVLTTDLKISLGIAMEATSFSALGVRFSVRLSVSALVESSEVTSLLSRV